MMIRNRLIYGTGFRADLITLLHIGNIGLKGIELAKLMCADNSTVSRILNDLKTSGFLNPHRRNEGIGDLYPGMFLSVTSVRNLCELMDATQFSMKELTLGALESLNFAHDAFGKRISKKVF
jgi:DNA-binding IclR family transcriptional regulator